MYSWKDYPKIHELFNRIMLHRTKCKNWEDGNPCFDCHFKMLHVIEEELKLGRWSYERDFKLKVKK